MIPKSFTLWLLLAVVIIKESLFRFAFHVGNQASSSAVRADAWHHRSDAITSAAAGIGIAIALWAGKGYESADDWAALFASGFIAWNGIRILKPAVDELMDALPSEEMQKEIASIALSCGGVLAVEKVLAGETGFVYWVDMHLEVPKDMTVEEAHAVAHVVKDKIRQQLPKITEVSIHVEPYPQKDLGLTSAIMG